MGDEGQVDIDIGNDLGEVVLNEDGTVQICGDCCCTTCDPADNCRTTTGWNVTIASLVAAADCAGCIEPSHIDNIVTTGVLDGLYTCLFVSELPPAGALPRRCLYRTAFNASRSVSFDTWFFAGCTSFLGNVTRNICMELIMQKSNNRILGINLYAASSSGAGPNPCLTTSVNYFSFLFNASNAPADPLFDCDTIPALNDCGGVFGDSLKNALTGGATAIVECVDPDNP